MKVTQRVVKNQVEHRDECRTLSSSPLQETNFNFDFEQFFFAMTSVNS